MTEFFEMQKQQEFKENKDIHNYIESKIRKF